MMLLVERLLGRATEPRFAGRAIERLAVRSAEASRRRLRRTTDGGTDVAIALPRGEYLAHGAVLADDGARIIVVEREPEDAFIVTFDTGKGSARLIDSVARVAHAFGNQHVQIEVVDNQLRGPVTTSRRVVESTIAALGLDDIEVEFDRVALGRERPQSDPPAHGHAHEQGVEA